MRIERDERPAVLVSGSASCLLRQGGHGPRVYALVPRLEERRHQLTQTLWRVELS